MNECVNCGKPIREERTTPADEIRMEPYWYHPGTNMTWCYDPNDPERAPDQRQLRAEPASFVR